MSATLDSSALQKAIKDTLKMSSRSAKSAVMGASIFFAQSGRKLTPIMRKSKRRDIVSAGKIDRRRRDSKGGFEGSEPRMWMIIRRHQNRPNTYIRTLDQNDKRRRIPNRGVAKNSWAGMLRSLNRRVQAFSKGNGVKLGSARAEMNDIDPQVFLRNELSYLPNIAPNVATEAMNKAARRMQGNLDRKVKRELERAWA